MKCATFGCQREALASSSGNRYAYCDACVRLIAARAFAPAERVPEWVRRARERTLVPKDYTR